MHQLYGNVPTPSSSDGPPSLQREGAVCGGSAAAGAGAVGMGAMVGGPELSVPAAVIGAAGGCIGGVAIDVLAWLLGIR